MKLGVLGPKGSFTDLASDYVGIENKAYFSDIISLIKAVSEGKIDKAIVPFENSLQGTVTTTIDAINEYSLFAEDALIMTIHHCIAALSRHSKHDTIMSHPQAIAQCRNYIEKRYPNFKIINTNSTSEAFETIRKENLLNALAIGSKKAAEIYHLDIVDENIEDRKNNTTKFFILRKGNVSNQNANKTLIVIFPEKENQGLLLQILKRFDDNKINLTKIESRPSKKRLGNYIFYIEFDGNQDDEKAKDSLEKIRKDIGNVKILGCYKERKIG